MRWLLGTAATKEDVAAFYKTALGKTGWKANRDELFHQDDKDIMVFRSPAGDMIWMEIKSRTDKRNVSLSYQTGAEIAASRGMPTVAAFCTISLLARLVITAKPSWKERFSCAMAPIMK